VKKKIIPSWLYVSACAVVLSLLISSPVFAAHPLITDDTGTQGKGKFQLEVNGEYAHEKEDGATENTMQLAATLSYGISDPLDIVLSVPYRFIRYRDSEISSNEEGFSDLTLEAKLRFFESDGLSFAFKPGITLPAGDDEKGLGAGKATYHLFFIASKEAKPWSFHLNLGYIRNENKVDDRKNIWHASLASTVEVIKDLKIVMNAGIEKDIDRNSHENPAFILGGLIYSLSENFDIDFGIKGGLTKPEADVAILAGISHRF
jgi:hypothetical protein